MKAEGEKVASEAPESNQDSGQSSIVKGMDEKNALPNKDPLLDAIEQRLKSFTSLTKTEQKAQLELRARELYQVALVPVVIRDQTIQRATELLNNIVKYLQGWLGARRKGWVEVRNLLTKIQEIVSAWNKPPGQKEKTKHGHRRPIKIVKKNEHKQSQVKDRVAG